MRAVLCAWAAVAIASGAAAQNQPVVPFIGCIVATGERFTGETVGIDVGRITGQSSKGASCVGVWQRLGDGRGIANYTCDDGRVGETNFDWLDPSSGTAIGVGQFTNGETVRFWSGTNLNAYLQQADQAERESMICNPPISENPDG